MINETMAPMILHTYVFFVAFGLCIMYFVLSYSLAVFFQWERPKFTLHTSLRTIALILLVAFLVFVVMNTVGNKETANRI